LPALVGLRAVAVAAVIMFHFAPSTLPGGFLGVDVFFVVSGFLIARLLIVELVQTGTVARLGFWARRVRRLLPAVVTMTIAVVVLASAKFSGIELHYLRAQAFGTLFYCANWVLIHQRGSYFASVGRPSPLLHMWSLAIEEQFYVVLPIVLYAFRRHVVRRPAVTAVVALLGAVGSTVWMAILAKPLADPTYAYFASGSHAMGLLVGVALGVIAGSQQRWTPFVHRLERDERLRAIASAFGTVAFVGVLASMRLTSFQSWRLFHGGFLLFSLAAGAVIAIVASCPTVPLSRVLARRWIVVIGLRSYSLYLWHWPVFVFVTPTTGLHGAWLFVARLVVTVVLAECSYRCIERPFRTGVVARKWRTRGALAYFTTAVIATMALVFTVAAPSALPSDAFAGSALASGPQNQIDVFGDSTAYMFVSVGSAEWAHLGVRIGGSAQLGCGTLNTPHVVGSIVEAVPPSCKGWRERWRTIAARDRNAKLVLMTGVWEMLDQRVGDKTVRFPTPEWKSLVRSALHSTIAMLARRGQAVYIFEVPCLDNNSAVPTVTERANALNTMFDQIAKEVPRVTVVHWRDLVCPHGKRANKLHGVGLWLNGDDEHLSVRGAIQVWKWWLPQLHLGAD
jgi:peptidoglycan/LPS O-acetylase OafA/YrhL